MTVETPTRSSPLQGWAGRFAALPDGVGVYAEPFVAMASLRTAPDGPGAARVGERLGLTLPARPSTWTEAAATAIRLGPDEWLLTSPYHSPAALEGEIRAALGPGEGAVVDVSAQRTTLRLRGAHARDLLATGCAVDLHPRAFPAGCAVQTTVGRVGVVLLGLGPSGGGGEDYRILVRASFAAHLAAWLVDAAVEFM